jgi:antitoxin component HigA of HigAB toxin-antitoxin module
MATRRARPVALVRAEHHEPPVKLDSKQRDVLGEALRRGEDLREEVEAKVLSYGRWLLANVFAGDTAAAVEPRSKNPVWLELVRRAGGPTLRVNRKTLYVALAIAAHDQRIVDQSWRGLDAGRKELLLPLGDDARLREAAQHVSKFNLTQPMTRAYVTEQLAEAGKSRQVRISAPRLVSRVRTLREGLGRPAVIRRVAELREGLGSKERAAVVEEIERLREVLGELSRAMRGKKA